MPSVMAHTFSQVPKAEIPRSKFNRSHGFKTTFNAGYLVPMFVDEVLPGDTFNLRMTGFARLATPLVPFMDNLFMETFYFFVPRRLLWDNWQKFNGEQLNPGDSTDFLIPQMQAPTGGYEVGSLSDYFGLPTGKENYKHDSVMHRAYNLIYNEWFRDENLQDSVPVPKGDGPDSPSDFKLLRRGKRHDYFTSCLPWPQKGPAVDIPLGLAAPIVAGSNIPITSNGLSPTFTGSAGSNVTFAVDSNSAGGAAYRHNYSFTNTTNSSGSVVFGGQSGLELTKDNAESHLYADLSQADAVTINSLRQAFALQKLFERDARGGTRYIEILQAHFHVTSPDARLQRPEFLGGGSTPININPIAQTSASGDGDTPQGNLAAIGTTSFSGHGFTKSFVEHGVVIGLVNVRADLNYQQGLNRKFSRRTRWDFYWPALSHIGEQAVLNKEIYLQGTADDELVFGYQERYAEYRYKPSLITGEFRSSFAQSLDIWHLAQDFANLPVLNAQFIEDHPPVERVVAVEDEPQFLFDSYTSLVCARPIPLYGVPGQIDRF